jgi:hypothetical protein
MPLIEIETPGGPVFALVAAAPGLRGVKVDADEVVVKAEAPLEAGLQVLGRIARATRAAFNDASVSGAEVTLNLQITGKGRFVVAELSAAAHFTVKLVLR